MLANATSSEVTPHIDVEKLESHMLSMPQVECPVVHHFGPQTYIREVTLPAGAIALGHAQRFPQLNVMLTGKVAMVMDDTTVKVLEAPMIFMGEPGRKAGYIIETCTWLNIYPNPTDERDIDKLEDMFLDKSGVFKSQEQPDVHQEDREDFLWLINRAGFGEDTVRAQSENLADQIPMPAGYDHVTIRKSPIEGKGVFLSYPCPEGSLIGPARIGDMRTPIGRYTNHSKTPNCEFIRAGDGSIWLRALDDIKGCMGGGQGDELTIDYAQALSLSGVYINRGEVQ